MSEPISPPPSGHEGVERSLVREDERSGGTREAGWSEAGRAICIQIGPEGVLEYRKQTHLFLRSRYCGEKQAARRFELSGSGAPANAARFGRFLSVRFDLGPLVRPVRDGLDCGGERASLLGQRVLDAYRRLGDNRAGDNPFRLEFLQPIAEHAIGDIGNRLAERREPTTRPQQDENDRPGPAPTDQLAGAVKARTQFRWMRWRNDHVTTG
jgi:hypothetical protein